MYEAFMRRAIALSCQGVETGGGPFGAVVVKDGEIIGEGTHQELLESGLPKVLVLPYRR